MSVDYERIKADFAGISFLVLGGGVSWLIGRWLIPNPLPHGTVVRVTIGAMVITGVVIVVGVILVSIYLIFERWTK